MIGSPGIDPPSIQSSARKTANRVYNAARWGTRAATVYEMEAASLPNQKTQTKPNIRMASLK
jgi:hypothetical protein